MPQFTLLPCTPSDVPDMAIVYNAAFVSDGISVVAMPSTIPLAVKNVWLYERLRLAFEKPGIVHWKLVDEETGRIAAWCRWEIPGDSNTEKGEKKEERKVLGMTDGAPELPEGANVAFWNRMFASIDGMRTKYARPDMHVCHFLITHPDYQGRGLGSKLIQHGLTLTDATNSRAYIEATKAGHPLYLKYGWRDVDVIKYDMREFGGKTDEEHRIMIRERQGGN